MASYKELKEQLKKLSEKAETARLAELQAIIEGVRSKVAEYRLTIADIFGRQHTKRCATKTPLPPRYHDPKTGARWNGRARAPDRIKGKKCERFQIGA
jgi:DNA-binding protein H-NS